MSLMPAVLISICFFFSGFSALLFEIVWCRLLSRVLGAGTVANACVFAAFMAGAAAGAFLAVAFPEKLSLLGKAAKGQEKSSFAGFCRAYGRLEFIVAISGILISISLDLLNGTSAPIIAAIEIDWLSNLVRFALCFVLMLLPCSAMGAIFATSAFMFGAGSEHSKPKNYFALLYGVNTLGAAIGSVTCAFHFLPQLGLAASSFIAATILIAIFLSCELLISGMKSELRGLRFEEHKEEVQELQMQELEEPGGSSSAALEKNRIVAGLLSRTLIVFLSGFMAIALELCFARIFNLVLGSSVYSVAAVLLMVLLGTAFASILIQFLNPPETLAKRLIACGFFFAGLSTLASGYLSHLIYWIFVESSTYVTPVFSQDAFLQAVFARIALAFVYVFFPAAFLGSILPLACKTLYGPALMQKSRGRASTINTDSILYGVNCMGAVLASVLFLPLLFPLIAEHTESAILNLLIAISLLSFLAAALLQIILFSKNKNLLTKSISFLAILLTLALPIQVFLRPPQWQSALMSSGFLVYKSENPNEPNFDAGGLQQDFYREGVNSTVSVSINKAANNICLKSDGKVEATLPLDMTLISPGSDMSTHVMLGALPVLFHDGPAKDNLLIGLGSGLSASSLLSFPEIEKLVIAELEPAVVAASKKLSAYNGDPFNKSKAGKIDLKIQDARFVLSSSAKTYDCIVSQPADPWVNGSQDLYSKEFWSIVYSRLNQKGVFCQWLQLYAIPESGLLSVFKTFSSVFDSVYICHGPGAGEILLLGFKGDADSLIRGTGFSAIEKIEKRLKQAHNSNKLVAAAGLANAYDSLSLIACGPEQISSMLNAAEKQRADSIGIVYDNKSKLEYQTSRSLLTSSSELENNLAALSTACGAGAIWYPAFDSDKAGASYDIAEMSLAYARQALADGSDFKSLNEKRAFAQAQTAQRHGSPFTYWSEARVIRALGHEQRAEAEIKKALQAKVSKSYDHFARFDIYFELGELDKAAEIQKLAFSRTEKKIPAWILREAMLYLRKNEPEKCLDLSSRLLEQEPCSLPALLAAAYAAEKLNKLELSASMFNTYLSINPWDFETQLSYTNLLCKKSELALAKLHARSASMLRPEDASALILLLACQLEKGDSQSLESTIKVLKEQSLKDEKAGIVLSLSDNGRNAETFANKRAFLRLVNEIRSRAEDPKNGYKMLGEP